MKNINKINSVMVTEYSVMDAPSPLPRSEEKNKEVAGEEKWFCPVLQPFARLPHWYRSTVPEVALSVCIGPDSIWLASIEVDHAYRHQGRGTSIINHLKALANRLALPLCLTAVGETPEWQLCLEAWYSSLGFVTCGAVMVYRPITPAATLTRCGLTKSQGETVPICSHARYMRPLKSAPYMRYTAYRENVHILDMSRNGTVRNLFEGSTWHAGAAPGLGSRTRQNFPLSPKFYA